MRKEVISTASCYNNLMDTYKLTTLKNGLKLITAPMPHVESVTVMIGIGAGSRYETKRVNGLFHFIEHMAFKGTKKRPRAIEIASEIDGVGGIFNAFTDKELTGYFVKLASEHTELAFDILSDMMINSLFKKEEIEKERGVIIEEINMYEDIPMRRVQEYFERLIYGDNPMGWDTAGEKASIKQIKREDFLSFQEKLYFPENMVVVVAGKLKEQEIKKLANKFLSKLRKTGKKVTKEIKLDQKSPRLNLATKKTEQAHFCLGVPGVAYSHPQRFAVGIVSGILGGGMSSRFFEEIRDKRGLAYYVMTIPEFFTDSGYVLTQAGVRLEKIEEAIKVVLAGYRDLAKNKVPAKELDKAKEHLKGMMILTLEDSQQVATRYALQAILEKIRTPQESMKLIDKITAEDVRSAAQELFKQNNLNLAIIGPYKDKKRFKKLLEA